MGRMLDRVEIAVFAGARTNTPSATDSMAWPDLCAEIEALCSEAHAEDKRDLPAILYGRLDGPRGDDNVRALTALAIDVDRITDADLEAAIEACPCDAIVYASPSDPNEDGTRRVRVVARLDRELEPADVKHARHAFAEVLGVGSGQGVENADAVSQLMFVGRVGDAPPRDFARIDRGVPLDVAELVALPLTHEWRSKAARIVPADDRPMPLALAPDARTDATAAALLAVWPAPGEATSRRQALRGLGGYLARRGWDDGQIATLAAALPAARPLEARVRLMVDTARQARAGDTHAAGYGELATALGAGRVELDAIEAAAKDPREPHGWAASGACWSEWWARRLAVKTSPNADTGGTSPNADTLALDLLANGQPIPSTINVRRALEWLWPGPTVRYEECHGRIITEGADLHGLDDGEWTDDHTTALQCELEAMDLRIGPQTVDRAVALHARSHRYNALRDMAMACAGAWDGEPRVDLAMSTYWEALDTEATRAASRVFLLSLAARALWPGAKVDTCLVLCDRKQGVQKSSSLAALVGDAWFSDSPLQLGDKDAAQAIRGKWLWEFSEGVAVTRRDRDVVKAFLSAKSDHYRPSFGRHAVTVPRTTCFAMTVNDEDWVADDGDARRWLPVSLRGVDIDVKAIRRDRAQLIGEAVARVLGNAGESDGPPLDLDACRARGSEPWWPHALEDARLAVARDAHRPIDPWTEAIEAWLSSRAGRPPRDEIRMTDLLDVSGPVPIPEERRDRRTRLRVGACLRALGFERASNRDGKVWRRV